jgi:hypothetical protein
MEKGKINKMQIRRTVGNKPRTIIFSLFVRNEMRREHRKTLKALVRIVLR